MSIITGSTNCEAVSNEARQREGDKQPKGCMDSSVPSRHLIIVCLTVTLFTTLSCECPHEYMTILLHDSLTGYIR